MVANGRPASSRVLFMGTPDFAVPTLEALLERYSVVGVATQPDRPAGRGRRVTASPVRQVAAAAGVPVLQPRSLKRDPSAVEAMALLEPDVVVVAAYGLILPPAVLDLAPHGALNVHASLLPRWRGAAPVRRAILAGDERTGVTIMRMDPGLDTGDILAQAATSIGADETGGELTRRLAELGARLLVDTLPTWLAGDIEPRPQDDAAATYASRIVSAERRLDWDDDAEALARRVRAFEPDPGCLTRLDGQVLKVRQATAVVWTGSEAAGTLVRLDDGWPAVTARGGALRLETVQPGGKSPMPGDAFLRGRPDAVGSQLGIEAEA